jgi:hypothetical protein
MTRIVYLVIYEVVRLESRTLWECGASKYCIEHRHQPWVRGFGWRGEGSTVDPWGLDNDVDGIRQVAPYPYYGTEYFPGVPLTMW